MLLWQKIFGIVYQSVIYDYTAETDQHFRIVEMLKKSVSDKVTCGIVVKYLYFLIPEENF